MLALQQASDDPRQLLVGVLLVKLTKPRRSSPGKLFLLRVIVDVFDSTCRLVEDVLELSIGLREFPAELDVHI